MLTLPHGRHARVDATQRTDVSAATAATTAAFEGLTVFIPVCCLKAQQQQGGRSQLLQGFNRSAASLLALRDELLTEHSRDGDDSSAESSVRTDCSSGDASASHLFTEEAASSTTAFSASSAAAYESDNEAAEPERPHAAPQQQHATQLQQRWQPPGASSNPWSIESLQAMQQPQKGSANTSNTSNTGNASSGSALRSQSNNVEAGKVGGRCAISFMFTFRLCLLIALCILDFYTSCAGWLLAVH